ncbi:MAG: zinc ribbon domain-containing protein [Clostridia bacterium]|nr:zinc ribbon domain-containing protein [Clostridia bacterium]
MLCSKCENELKDGAKFCDKCGKKVKKQEGMKKRKTLAIIITSIIIIASIAIILVVINNKNNVNNFSNESKIKIDSSAPNEAVYSFTLDEMKLAMDKTCEENNITQYPDFYNSRSTENGEVYETFKDENNGSTSFAVEVNNGYVSKISFTYTDEMLEYLATGGDRVFFDILKNVYEEDDITKIKSIFENLNTGKYEFYNNTLCYKERYDNFGMTEYSISAISNECYADMLKNYPENFESTENKLNENTNISTNENTIDRTTFINNLTADDKEHIGKYVKSTFDLTNDENFVEDRIEIVGNELIYIYLNIDLKQANGTTVYSSLRGKYYSIIPITDIPENWKEIDYSILPNYLFVGEISSEDIVRLDGAGLTDEQVNNGIAEANPKIEEKINKYKEIHNSSLSEDAKKILLNMYLQYTRQSQKAIADEFETAYMKVKQNPDKLDYQYMKEISESKTLYIKFFEKSTIAQNYKETDSTEYCAMGILIDINYSNIPIFLKIALEDESILNNWVPAIQLLFINKAIPEISNSSYVVTPIKKETTKPDTYDVSNEFINYICSHFGV